MNVGKHELIVVFIVNDGKTGKHAGVNSGNIGKRINIGKNELRGLKTLVKVGMSKMGNNGRRNGGNIDKHEYKVQTWKHELT